VDQPLARPDVSLLTAKAAIRSESRVSNDPGSTREAPKANAIRALRAKGSSFAELREVEVDPEVKAEVKKEKEKTDTAGEVILGKLDSALTAP
jgi:hypothetical protein